MDDESLYCDEAARRLGISKPTLYDWLGRSDAGCFQLRGQPITIDYLQGGPQGQGRIRIDAREVRRLNEAMRVTPRWTRRRRPPRGPVHYPGITVELGDPDDPPRGSTPIASQRGSW